MQKKVTTYRFGTLFLHALKNAFNQTFNRGIYIYARACARVSAVVLVGFMIFSAPLAAAITGQYRTADTGLKPGMAVAISGNQTPQPSETNSDAFVERASMQRANQTVGIVVNAGEEFLGVASQQSSGSLVDVANSGQVEAYVTDVNGEPKAGDLLAPSPLKGLLMRASEGTVGIVGSLLSDFPAAEAKKLEVDGSAKTEFKVALVTINMDARTSVKSSSGIGFLQRIGQNIVGHSVSPAQVFVAMTVLALVIVVAGAILYATISSYVTSLGRNPLAAKKLFSGLLQIVGLVATVLAVGAAAIYLVLRI